MMKIHRAAVVFVSAIMTAACSEKQSADGNKAPSDTSAEQVRNSKTETPAPAGASRRPSEGKIGADVVAFVRATRVVPAAGASADCPGCPPGGAEVLTMRQMKIDEVSCSGDTCTVVVTIRAEFNPGSGEKMAGGLTGWIPPEQRTAYLSGHTPPGEQAFRVQMIYKLRGEGWQPVEFDRAPGA